jgi:hypothetical protein
MSDFETPCLCLARDAMQHKPIEHRWVGIQDGGGTLWAIFPECPAHPGEHLIAPVWTQRYGRLDKDEGAAESTAPIEVMSSGEAL